MADILFYLAAYGAERVHKKINDARSPLVPIPPPSSSTTSTIGSLHTEHELAPVYTREPVSIPPTTPSLPSNDLNHSISPLSRSSSFVTPASPIRPTPRTRSHSHTPQIAPLLTEHKLKELHIAWKIRYQSLYLRLATLLDAMRRGLRNSWAGRVSWDRCDEVRLAIIEAEFVMGRLSEAVQWCEEKGLRKLPLVSLVKGKRRRSVSRATHSSSPPSLAHLPYPLPEAPPAISTRLTVALPSWVFRPEQTRPDSSMQLPPEYTPHHDPFKGERLIERARWEDERVPDGADQVVLILPLSSNSAVTNVNTHVDDDSSSNHNHLDPNVFNFNSVPPASFQPTPRFDTHVSQNLFDQSLGFAPEGTSDETSYFPHPLPPQGLQYPSHGFLNEQFYPNPLPSAQTQHSYNYQYPPPPLPLQGPQGPSRATHHDQHYDDQFYHVHNNFVQNQSSYNYQYPPQSNSLRKLPLSHRQTLLYGV
ncbi:uncharacterized protein JCM6883_001013 [Sporobolomyces salmoneus]|uniref:uncharacterized protein n=1 Tax=Sporobolomyces salmoneus TaxID=183962 RepID=UPI00318076D5